MHIHRFPGGKLPGAINVPTDAFKDDEKVDRLVGELKARIHVYMLLLWSGPVVCLLSLLVVIGSFSDR